MTLDEYQDLAMRTKPHVGDLELVMHSLHGMVGEIGEVHSLYQKVYQGHELDVDHLQSELGDLLWFIAEFAYANGWSLSDVAERNINKLRLRFPNGFEEDKSLNRKKGDI